MRQAALIQFQSRGRFFGGADPVELVAPEVHFMFQSRGRFFGGADETGTWNVWPFKDVSIAGAILWGC